MARELFDISPLLPLAEAGYVLLTPNFRLARRVKAEWDRYCSGTGMRAWEPLPVMPLESWLLQQWEAAVTAGLAPPRVLLGAPQLLELWQQAIASQEQGADEYHLLRPAAAAEIASQARTNLLRWQVDMRQPAIRQAFGLDTDCSTFLAWLDLFEQRLDAAGQATPADCIRTLSTVAAELPRRKVALLEFDDIPPLYRATVEALSEQVTEVLPAATAGRRVVHACANKRAELETVARWVAATSKREPDSSIGVVLSDMQGERTALEYLLRREFDCLGERYASLPVNFSTGIALDRAPVIRDALAALALAGPRTTLEAVVALLQSRYLHLPDAGTALAVRFITRLYDAGREELATAELRFAASEVQLGEHKGLVLGEHLLAVSRLRDLRQAALPSAWIDRFCEVLAAWGWPGPGPLDSLEYQQIELWYRTLDEFRGYDSVCAALPFDQALKLLRNSCAQQVSQPQTADCPIQVLGPLEAAGLSFDHLWLCGIQAGSWPAAPRPNPFVPMSLQRRLQMPHATAEREWEFAAALFDQYARSTPLLRASYCDSLDDVPELPSALLEEFSPEPVEPVPKPDPAWLQQWQQRQVEYLPDEQAPPVDPDELAGISGGSGLLEDQSQCPFRAFARRRLGVEPLAAPSLALSPGERGSLLHDALYALWGELADLAGLLALDETAERAAVERAVQVALGAVPGNRRRALGPAYWRLEGQRLAGLLGEWLAVEKLRGEFVVYQREQDVALALGQLQIRLRVDRIDQLPDGSQVIIDYKSGSSKVQDWLGERPARPQLLLYGIAVPDVAAALAFAQVRARDCKFVGLGRTAAAPGIQTDIGKAVRERMDASDWASLNARWRDNLERLADEFVAGRAGVDPLAPASCTWCGLQPLCRIGATEEEPA